MEIVLLVHAACTLALTGLIWFVQVVHYPLMSRVGDAQFGLYHRDHVRLTGRVVVVPMVVEAATAVLLAWRTPAGVGPGLPLVGLVLLGVAWISTWSLQVPAHRRLAAGFCAATHRRLVATNWVRAAAWTLRTVLVLIMLREAGG